MWIGRKSKPPYKKEETIINPFDKFSNAKKKHEVLNRKVKGEERNVAKARSKVLTLLFDTLCLNLT